MRFPGSKQQQTVRSGPCGVAENRDILDSVFTTVVRMSQTLRERQEAIVHIIALGPLRVE